MRLSVWAIISEDMYSFVSPYFSLTFICIVFALNNIEN